MQLFLVPYEIQKDKLVVSDKNFLHQLRNVLRASRGYVCYIQDILQAKDVGCMEKNALRYKCVLDQLTAQNAVFSFTEKIPFPCCAKQKTQRVTMCIALPNKAEKLELIVQKLTEIGICDIVFWKAKRSILSGISQQKFERLQKIAREAVEQSRGRYVPTISFVDDVGAFLKKQKDCGIVVFDKCEIKEGESEENQPPPPFSRTLPKQANSSFLASVSKGNKREIPILDVNMLEGNHAFTLKKMCAFPCLIGIIGPEGGFDVHDHATFTAQENYLVHVSLGNSVLRMETAAIVGSRLLIHLKSMFGKVRFVS